MTDLILALVAFIALLGMIRKNTFHTIPKPSRWLAIGLGTIVASRTLGWLSMIYLSRTVAVDTYATAHMAISIAMGVASATALAFMVTAVFVSRQPNGPSSVAQG